MKATEKDLELLEALYRDRKPFRGELHDHAATGGTSDGQRPLSHWLGAMEALQMDFAAILDHRQVRHMYQPEWQDGVFLGATEPGTGILDSKAENKSLHYNILFAKPETLEDLLEAFPEYNFTGGPEGHFVYPRFTTERFCELIDAIKARGGLFVHPHPKQVMVSEDPLDYWFRDETGIEVIYGSLESDYTKKNYKLWTDLLALGKRVWACAGGDGHACCRDRAITTIYAEEKANESYLAHLRVGDFVCGATGIRMCMGDTAMGGKCTFEGKRLVLNVADFHASVRNPEHTYRVDLLDDQGVVFSEEITCTEPATFAIDADPKCKFYRAEVFDTTRDLRIAIGNPIWNAEVKGE